MEQVQDLHNFEKLSKAQLIKWLSNPTPLKVMPVV